MKIAVTGKGGVGKTTFAAGLVSWFASTGRGVFAIDADPDSNLALSLSFPNPEEITPLVQMKALIQERTGAPVGAPVSFFKLNPFVGDIPEKYLRQHGRVRLAVMGSVKGAGTGCVCPESAFLKAVLNHLVLQRKQVAVVDMDAGLEHLGRGTARGVDYFIIVVEPGQKSVETARRIEQLATELKIGRVFVVGNKVRGEDDRAFIQSHLNGFQVLGWLAHNETAIEADMGGLSLWDASAQFQREIRAIGANLIEENEDDQGRRKKH